MIQALTAEEFAEMHKFVEAARARCEAAAPGPWESRLVLWDGDVGGVYVLVGSAAQFTDGKDATFCAHARDDLPAALDYIGRLYEMVMALRMVRIGHEEDGNG